MKSTMNMIRSATSTAIRQYGQVSSNISKCCRQPPGKTSATIRRLTRNKKAIGGGFLLAAPSFLVTPADTMIYDDVDTASQPTNLSSKSPLSTSNNVLAPESLKDSFEVFLQSIEPLINETRMNVGVSCIPHPAKVAKGGEDAYFLSNDMKVIGIADGVGGWGDIGVDPALYSKSLMRGSKLFTDNAICRNPEEIMSEGYQYSTYVQGSSTACIIVLRDNKLWAANLGDSGFMVIRGLDIIYRTKEQQHSFNFPYQIGTGSADKPQDSQKHWVDVQFGDLIIAGTDGLWDNLFDEDIVEVVANAPHDPASIAQQIARQAHLVANDKDIISPFSKSARSNGYPLATGGKLDDITVVVGRVCPAMMFSDNNAEPMTLSA